MPSLVVLESVRIRPMRALKIPTILEHIFTLSHLLTKENIDIMKTETFRFELSFYFKLYLRFKLRFNKKSMDQNLRKYLKPVSIILAIFIVIAGFIYVGNKLRTKEIRNQIQRVELSKLTLEVDGYGYTVGDIVQIKKVVQPAPGDVVIFDPFKNKSMCLGMGPSMSLGKIVGLPGESISFQNDVLKIRTEQIKLDRDYSQQAAVFGGQKYKNLTAGITLKNREYLLNKWVGFECFNGELDETGSSIPYNRFTVNEDAISGVIEKKIGHDNQAEKEFKNRIY